MKSLVLFSLLLVTVFFTIGCGGSPDEVLEESGSFGETSAAEEVVPGVDPDVVAQLLAAGVDLEKIQPTFVYASASNIRDEHLKLFAKMPELKTLSLGKTAITGSGLKDLNCPKLQSLLLFETQVTDAGVRELPPMPGLETLSLAGTPIDGSCLEHIAKYITLTALELQQTKISDASLAPLEALKVLSRLELRNTAITDDGLEYLLNCPKLYTVDLANTQVTDTGAIALTAKVQLFKLNLNGTGVTDEFIRSLVGQGSEELRMLHLKGTRLTVASAELFGQLSKLRQLDVRETGISDDDLAYLPDALESLQKLNEPGLFDD